MAIKNKFARLHFLYFILIISTAFFLCGMVVFYIHWSLLNIGDEFKNNAAYARNHIRDQLTQNETVLIGLGSFLKTRSDLDIVALDAYATVMMQRFPHISMFQIAQRMDAASALSYEEIMRRQGIANPIVSQFGGAQVALNSKLIVGTLPVVFVGPESSRAVLGLDLSTIDFIRQSLPSVNVSEMTLSEPIELFEGDKALVMMQSIPPDRSNSQGAGYVSLLLVKQSMLFQRQNLDERWNISVVAKSPNGKTFLMGELISQVDMSADSYFFHTVVVAEDVQFSSYKINVKLSKNVSWLDVNLWAVALLIVVALGILGLMIVVYRQHFSFELRRERHQKTLFKQANYDSLTKLPNRFYFEDTAQRILSNAERHKLGVLVLFVDLNGLKYINDTFGHDAGDKVLVAVACALKAVLRQSDLAARLGGDEFSILIEDVKDLISVLTMIEKIRQALSLISVDGIPTEKISGSVGFAYSLQHGYDLKKLLKVADNSMYGEKHHHHVNN